MKLFIFLHFLSLSYCLLIFTTIKYQYFKINLIYYFALNLLHLSNANNLFLLAYKTAPICYSVKLIDKKYVHNFILSVFMNFEVNLNHKILTREKMIDLTLRDIPNPTRYDLWKNGSTWIQIFLPYLGQAGSRVDPFIITFLCNLSIFSWVQ